MDNNEKEVRKYEAGNAFFIALFRFLTAIIVTDTICKTLTSIF